MKKLYLFDFDGTLTYKDTMFMFLKFYNPSRFTWQFLKHSPLFTLVKLNLADPEKVKKSFIASIIKGESQYQIQKKSQAFFDANFPHIFRENALDFIKNINEDKTDTYIVSASLDIWVEPFAKHFGMELLATKAQFVNEQFTGEFASKNCNGEEKVNRIKEAVGQEKYDKTIAFGDTSGDKAMLSWANEGHFQFFH